MSIAEGLTYCFRKLSGGKKPLIDREDQQDILRNANEKSKAVPRPEAERAAVEEYRQQAESDRDYILNQIKVQLGISAEKKDTGSKKAPDSPDNAAPERPAPGPGESSRVFSKTVRPMTGMEKIRSILKVKGDSIAGHLANKFFGNATTAIGRAHARGETGAMSNANPGRVSIEAAVGQGNAVIRLVSHALDVGHIMIDKAGRVLIEKSDKYNIRAMKPSYIRMQKRLREMGYHDDPRHEHDTQTVSNMMTLALFGPRLEALVKEGHIRPDQYTAQDKAITDRLRADPSLKKDIEEFHGIYNHLRGKAVDAMVASGLKTREAAKEFVDRSEYLPLYRLDEQGTLHKGEPENINSLLAAAREHHLTSGSDLSIGDPLENVYTNLSWLQSRAIKNNAANLIAEGLVAHDAARWSKVKHPDSIAIARNGEVAYLDVKDQNDAMAFSAAPVLTGAGWAMARKFSNGLRRGITMMPGFVWSQAAQDAQRVGVMTGQGFGKAYVDIAKGLKDNFGKESPTAAILRKYGIEGARDYVDTAENFRKSILDQRTEIGQKWYDGIKHFEELAVASDLSAREAAYKKRFADYKRENPTASDAEAEFEAQHAARMMIDFNNRGNSRSLAALMTVAPFINARIQGSHRMWDALHGRIPGMSKEAAQQMALMQIGKLMAFTIAYSMYKADDPEYENQNTAVRNNNFLLGPFKMPVAGELIPFKVIAESVARHAIGTPNEDAYKTRMALTDAAMNVLLGPSDMIPSIVRPTLEAATNHSFFTGHDLVSKSMEGMSASEQYTQGTSETMKGVAKALESGMQSIGFERGISPIVLENYINGTFGRAGQEALALIKMVEAATGNRPELKINEYPVVGAFFANPQGNALRSDFQEVADRVNRIKLDIGNMERNGRWAEAQAARKKNADLIALQGSVNAVQSRLNQISKQWKLGPKTAEDRDRMYQQQLQALKQVSELRKRAGFSNLSGQYAPHTDQ
jgi:hypothetical protein